MLHASGAAEEAMLNKIFQGFVLGAIGATACAQPYPSKPLRIIVPYAPGGGVDIVARTLGQELTRRLGQQIVIENKTGAGGNIGSDAVAKATPDGYTLLIASPANAVNPSLYSKMPFNPVRDLAPVALIAIVPAVLLASPALPVKSVKELIALAKAKPGTLNFGSGGSGTTEHLAGEMLNAQAGIDMLHVPYKGGAAVLPDLISGQISLFFVNQLFALPYVKAGTVKALGVASDERSPALPDVPTFAENGYADFRVSVWYGIMAPAATPKAIVAQLNREINAALASPEMKERLQTMSAKALPGTSADFAAFFADEMTRWARVVKASGAKAD
jgi:tripartite-type tricarboxylate transporter receptor subunit TctC